MSKPNTKCDLCGATDGKEREIDVPYYGRVIDIAIQKYPFYRCICRKCQSVLDNLDKSKKDALKKRADFVSAEYARRRKNNLCEDCGGEIETSGPYMVYEGTYATKYRCKQCGKRWEYT